MRMLRAPIRSYQVGVGVVEILHCEFVTGDMRISGFI